MATAYFFASPIDVEIKLEGEDLRKKVDTKLEKEKTVSCPVYFDGESVSGQVRAHLCCDHGGGNTRACNRLWYEYEMARRLYMMGLKWNLSAA